MQERCEPDSCNEKHRHLAQRVKAPVGDHQRGNHIGRAGFINSPVVVTPAEVDLLHVETVLLLRRISAERTARNGRRQPQRHDQEHRQRAPRLIEQRHFRSRLQLPLLLRLRRQHHRDAPHQPVRQSHGVHDTAVIRLRHEPLERAHCAGRDHLQVGQLSLVELNMRHSAGLLRQTLALFS